VLAFLALLLIVHRSARPEGRAAAALVATSGPVAGWAVGGLETAGFALAATAALLAAERTMDAGPSPGAARKAFAAGCLCGLAEWTRPEGALIAAVLLAALAAAWVRRRGAAPAPLASAAAGFALLFVPRLAARVLYYGDWVPNTAHVKVSSGLSDLGLGVEYVVRCLSFTPVLALMGLCAAFRLLRGRTGAGEKMLFALLAIWTAYVIQVGGDHMPWYRFVVPMIPIVTVLGVRSLPRAIPLRLAVPALACIGLASAAATTWIKAWNEPDPAARYGGAVGRWIHEQWPADALVALNTAGSTAYFGGMPCIDMLGLNDRAIATRRMPPPPSDLKWALKPGHRKGDGAYVLSRRPDYVILGGSAGEGLDKPWFSGDRELAESPEFRAGWMLREADIPANGTLPPVHFKYFERRDRLSAPPAATAP